MQQTEIIKAIPSAVTVKNARLFFDNKRSCFRLVHYNDEILTVQVIEPTGQQTIKSETRLEVINIFPVSASSINAIIQALDYLGIKESYEDICEKLDIDYRKLSYDFWGFDPHKRVMHYDPNRRSTFEDGPFTKRNKDQWYLIQEELLNQELPESRSNLKYYLLDGFDGNDTVFRKVVKSSTYEAIEHYIKQVFNSYGIRKFEYLGGDPEGWLATYKNGETRLSISLEDLEFKNDEDKKDTLDHYRKYWNGIVTLDFKEKYLQ